MSSEFHNSSLEENGPTSSSLPFSTTKRKNIGHTVTVSRLTNTIYHRIVNRMKVTAIIADDLISNVKKYTQSSTVTEAITIVLKDWLDLHNIKELNEQIKKNPIVISNGKKTREINRLK